MFVPEQGISAFIMTFFRFFSRFLSSKTARPSANAAAAAAAADAADAPLVAVTRRFAGRTIDEALRVFEDACSEENVDSVVIGECREHPGGILVSYEVRWKHSVFDDYAYGNHEARAFLTREAPDAGESADACFRVAEATAEHHIKGTSNNC